MLDLKIVSRSRLSLYKTGGLGGIHTPIELIKISGNIQKCAGCRRDIKERLSCHTVDNLSFENYNAQYCLQHKEEDYVFFEKANKWLRKCDNKHYHVSRDCIIERNPHFEAISLQLSVPHTTDFELSEFYCVMAGCLVRN